jgi:hypothetical protein
MSGGYDNGRGREGDCADEKKRGGEDLRDLDSIHELVLSLLILSDICSVQGEVVNRRESHPGGACMVFVAGALFA